MESRPPPGEGGGAATSARRRAEPTPPPCHPQASPIDRLEALICATWPDVFNRAQPKPLELGVHRAIADHLDLDGAGRQQLRRVMRRWVGNDRYLAALTAPGAVRVSLDGRSAGPVSPEHRRCATERMEARQQTRRSQQNQRPTNHRLPTLHLGATARRRSGEG